jgi:hypothetical protein
MASFKQHWTSQEHKRTGSKVKEKYCNTKIAVGVVEAEQKWVALLVDGYFFSQTLRLTFCVLLTVHLGIIFVINQHDAQFFFMYVYFYSTTSGISHSV